MTDTFTYTPGPWFTMADGENIDIRAWDGDERPWHVAVAIGSCGYTDDPSTGSTTANARLIASAPAMLEALKALVDAIDYRETPEGKHSYATMGSMPPAFHAARAAIALATGETQ